MHGGQPKRQCMSRESHECFSLVLVAHTAGISILPCTFARLLLQPVLVVVNAWAEPEQML